MLHKFRNHELSKDTKILIIGTFHPDIDNGADFFYSRSRNYLWTILPACYKQPNLKGADLTLKLEFMRNFKIDFIDIIESLANLPVGQENNYADDFIDSYIHKWKDVETIINSLNDLKWVYFTRKTFKNIPNIEKRISEIRSHCQKIGIRFCFLDTPSRFVNQNKILNWTNLIVHQENCL